jgi:cyclopropane fatty-acyl-phospholipid synthase-like methyltransferase
MDRYKTTFETWNKVADLYQEKFMDLDLYNDTYDIFCRLAKKEAVILEIGCGPGNITKYIAAQRPDLKITGTDVAPNMIALAKANIPTADFEILDCRELDSITKKFDGIICGFCIPYLSKEDVSKLLKDSFNLLNENGVLYLSTIKGDYAQSGFEAASTGDRSYVYYYDEEYFKQELNENGFALLELIEKNFIKANGSSLANQVFIARKN